MLALVKCFQVKLHTGTFAQCRLLFNVYVLFMVSFIYDFYCKMKLFSRFERLVLKGQFSILYMSIYVNTDAV